MVVQEVSLMCNRNALCWLTRYGKCHLETLIYVKFLGTYELWTSKRVWVIGYWRVWVMLIKCLQTNMGVQEMYGSLKSMADQGYGLLERETTVLQNINKFKFFVIFPPSQSSTDITLADFLLTLPNLVLCSQKISTKSIFLWFFCRVIIDFDWLTTDFQFM